MAIYSYALIRVRINNELREMRVPVYHFDGTKADAVALDIYRQGATSLRNPLMPSKIIFDDGSNFGQVGKTLTFLNLIGNNGDYTRQNVSGNNVLTKMQQYVFTGDAKNYSSSLTSPSPTIKGYLVSKNENDIVYGGVVTSYYKSINSLHKYDIVNYYSLNFSNVGNGNNYRFSRSFIAPSNSYNLSGYYFNDDSFFGIALLITTDDYIFPICTNAQIYRSKDNTVKQIIPYFNDKIKIKYIVNPTDKIPGIIQFTNNGLPTNVSQYRSYVLQTEGYGDDGGVGNCSHFLQPCGKQDNQYMLLLSNFLNIYDIYGGIDLNPYDPGGTTDNTEDNGETEGTWVTPHSGEKDDHTGYNDLEASLFRVYALNKRQMSALSQSIWNPNVLTAVLQKIGGIEKLIIGLYSYPFEVNHEGSEININFNWLDAWADGVQAKGYQVTQEYQQINFGNIEIPNFSGTFYDYQPFSTAQLYIPYIGFIPLKMNEIIGCKLNLKFNINVCTGDFCAVVSVLDKKDPLTRQNYNMTIGMYNGNISRPLPLSRQEMFEVYKAGATLLGATAGAVMGAKTAMTGQMDLNKYLGNYETLKGQVEAANSYAHQYNSMRQNPDYNDGRNMAYVRPPEKNTKPYLDEITRGSRQAGSSMANAISAVTQANAPIERSGNLGGVVGRCSSQKAFILISYPHQNISGKQNILGYATNVSGPLSNDFKGYTEVREIRIKDSNATSSELAEIEKIVKGGIII